MSMENIKKDLTYSKSQQKVELILANPKFQSEIKFLREKWKIPPDGFRLEESKIVRTKKGVMFQESRGDLGKWEDWLVKSKKSNEFWQDLDNLRRITLKPYRLSDRWLFFLQRYLLYSSTMPEAGLMIYLKKDEITGEPEIWIRIEGDTRLEDIKKAWKDIKKEQKEFLLNYIKRAKEMSEINKMILKLAQEGLSNKEISEKIKNVFGKTIQLFDIAKVKHKFKKKYLL